LHRPRIGNHQALLRSSDAKTDTSNETRGKAGRMQDLSLAAGQDAVLFVDLVERLQNAETPQPPVWRRMIGCIPTECDSGLEKVSLGPVEL